MRTSVPFPVRVPPRIESACAAVALLQSVRRARWWTRQVIHQCLDLEQPRVRRIEPRGRRGGTAAAAGGRGTTVGTAESAGAIEPAGAAGACLCHNGGAAGRGG